jgi:multiple sugar transport system permease protein
MTAGLAGRPWRERRRLWAHAPLVLVALVTMLPFLIMLMTSLRFQQAITFPDAFLPTNLNFGAYDYVLSNGRFLRWLANTTIYSVTSVVLVLLFASIAAYAFAKKRFPGRRMLFWTFIAMLMVPYQLTLIPQFILISKMGLVDTMTGLIVPTLANAQALFLMRQFIAGIPDELIEAARIDGAGTGRIFWSVVLPLSKPLLAVLTLLSLMYQWNDFLWPLIVLRDPTLYTLPIGLQFLKGQYTTDYGALMAMTLISVAPLVILFLAFQRFFVQGLATTGLK